MRTALIGIAVHHSAERHQLRVLIGENGGPRCVVPMTGASRLPAPCRPRSSGSSDTTASTRRARRRPRRRGDRACCRRRPASRAPRRRARAAASRFHETDSPRPASRDRRAPRWRDRRALPRDRRGACVRSRSRGAETSMLTSTGHDDAAERGKSARRNSVARRIGVMAGFLIAISDVARRGGCRAGLLPAHSSHAS